MHVRRPAPPRRPLNAEPPDAEHHPRRFPVVRGHRAPQASAVSATSIAPPPNSAAAGHPTAPLPLAFTGVLWSQWGAEGKGQQSIP
ncbi:hypothetical protein BRADI_3g50047v3 [Brachypodium distachyon]|uniref:Uncharacterized protein n=1 Tax=Brachypodium distachyon TaxID=15368 RepID=A0A2K2D4E9_BRADI|nr:hypothetical protein BRADI_3g50047v3 [Brachypodium distachyon]